MQVFAICLGGTSDLISKFITNPDSDGAPLNCTQLSRYSRSMEVSMPSTEIKTFYKHFAKWPYDGHRRPISSYKSYRVFHGSTLSDLCRTYVLSLSIPKPFSIMNPILSRFDKMPKILRTLYLHGPFGIPPSLVPP